MEINSIDLIRFDLSGVDLNSIDINTDNSIGIKDDYIPSVQNPYIKGHITTSDNTFTFKVNNTNTSVSVDANGNFKYKPTSTITSLSFVGVPQLESLELFKINGVTTFDVDYPTEVIFKKCDNTTQSAKVDVYHIRGIATDDFDFTLKYIDDNNNVTEVTESAVIDGDGNWDVSYSGKRINYVVNTFKENSNVKSIEITEDLDVASISNTFSSCSNLESISIKNATLNNLTNVNSAFFNCTSLSKLILSKATFTSVANTLYAFNFDVITEFDVPQNSTAISLSSVAANTSINLKWAPLSYESMCKISNWLKNITGYDTRTITFRKATYDALTAEQQTTLQGIIVTQKNWILATV